MPATTGATRHSSIADRGRSLRRRKEARRRSRRGSLSFAGVRVRHRYAGLARSEAPRSQRRRLATGSRAALARTAPVTADDSRSFAIDSVFGARGNEARDEGDGSLRARERRCSVIRSSRPCRDTRARISPRRSTARGLLWTFPGKAQIQLDLAQIQLDYADTTTAVVSSSI